jgi:hypothetical protein
MRYLLDKPIFFILFILSAAFYFQQGSPSAGAASAMPSLTGEAAVSHAISKSWGFTLRWLKRRERRGAMTVLCRRNR